MRWYGILTSKPTRGMGRYINFFASHATGWDGVFVGYPICQALVGISTGMVYLWDIPCLKYDLEYD